MVELVVRLVFSLAVVIGMLLLLARERSEGRLAIEPRALWCGGEGLTQADRAAIEQAFGCPVVEDYGASECMNMAFACRHGRLHVNEDWVTLEPVDERGDRAARQMHRLRQLPGGDRPPLAEDVEAAHVGSVDPCRPGDILVEGLRDVLGRADRERDAMRAGRGDPPLARVRRACRQSRVLRPRKRPRS